VVRIFHIEKEIALYQKIEKECISFFWLRRSFSIINKGTKPKKRSNGNPCSGQPNANNKPDKMDKAILVNLFMRILLEWNGLEILKFVNDSVWLNDGKDTKIGLALNLEHPKQDIKKAANQRLLEKHCTFYE
jgi:hypothetical protein